MFKKVSLLQRYRIVGNFSEFETLTIFASSYENAKVYNLQELGSKVTC